MSPECSTDGFRKPRDGPRGFLNILESSRIIRNGSNRVEIEDLGLKLCGNESPGCCVSNGSPPDPLKPTKILPNSRFRENRKNKKNQKIIYETPDQPPFKAADMFKSANEDDQLSLWLADGARKSCEAACSATLQRRMKTRT